MSDPAIPLDPQKTIDEEELEQMLAEHGIARATVDALKQKYSRLYMLRDQPVIFRMPQGAEFDRLSRKSANERFAAVADLVKRHVVHPDAEGYAALLEEYPLLFASIEGAIGDIAKGKKTVDAKKL